MTNTGFEAVPVTVECDSTKSLPAISIVGLASKTTDEARDRLRSALRNSSLELPARKYTINLAPAEVPKNDSGLDLAMAVALLASTGQLRQEQVDKYSFYGELGLDGSLRPIKAGLLKLEQLTTTNPNRSVILPNANLAEARLIADRLQIYGFDNLQQLYRFLIGETKQPTIDYRPPPIARQPAVSLSDIVGQELAKRALEIAAAGGHNLLMNGPPGSGKTLLAKALPGLLPSLTPDEAIEITKLHGLSGANDFQPVSSRPFRSPHHSASMVALIGGGNQPTPGEISLAHRGVLFMDELPEYSRQAIEALRQPLEDGLVTISRAKSKSVFPADFQLVATQNPCPCGFATDPSRDCTCTAHEINRYTKKISGPVLDRIDLIVEVGRINQAKIIDSHRRDTTDDQTDNRTQARIESARQLMRERQTSSLLNASLSGDQLKEHCRLDVSSAELLQASAEKLRMSARAIHKSLRVARTIADLESSPEIQPSHIAESLQFRKRATFQV